MTEQIEPSTEDSRRSFMKKGALASGALALGATGTAAAQQGGNDGTTTQDGDAGLAPDESGEGIVQVATFYPDARFTFVSGVIDWSPDVPEVSDDIWDSYNTYQIRWLNTNEIVPFWVESDTTLAGYDDGLGFIPDDEDSDQPQVYEMDREWELFDEGNDLVEVTFSTVPEDEEDQILANDDWWGDTTDGGGTGTNGTPTDSGGNGSPSG